jgi:hypothetical protein
MAGLVELELALTAVDEEAMLVVLPEAVAASTHSAATRSGEYWYPLLRIMKEQRGSSQVGLPRSGAGS